jgi:PAS domain S-box-containing protein
VVEASPDVKIVINRLREVIDCNEEAEFLFGYARGDTLGKPIENLMPKDSREHHSKHVANLETVRRPDTERSVHTAWTLHGSMPADSDTGS